MGPLESVLGGPFATTTTTGIGVSSTATAFWRFLVMAKQEFHEATYKRPSINDIRCTILQAGTGVHVGTLTDERLLVTTMYMYRCGGSGSGALDRGRSCLAYPEGKGFIPLYSRWTSTIIDYPQ